MRIHHYLTTSPKGALTLGAFWACGQAPVGDGVVAASYVKTLPAHSRLFANEARFMALKG